MKKYDKEPNLANLIDFFEKDYINRNGYLIRFVELLKSIDDSYSIAIDGSWGTGKTFFVKQAKIILESYNSYLVEKSDKKESLSKVKAVYDSLCKQNSVENKEQLIFPIYYDAWLHDSDTDPMLSLIYSVMNETGDVLKNWGKKDIIANFLAIINSINLGITVNQSFSASISIGDIKNELDKYDDKSFLKNIQEAENVKNYINEFFEELLPEKCNRLVIFIDELDRCSPIYAIKLLERVKHYFNNTRITFVFSVNLFELQNSIKVVYGKRFDANRYLDRFFDLRMVLPEMNIDDYVRFLIGNSHSQRSDFIKHILNQYSFTMREINRFLKINEIAVGHYDEWNEKFDDANDPDLEKRRFYHYIKAVFSPLLIALKFRDLSGYESFTRGTNVNLFLRFVDNESYKFIYHPLCGIHTTDIPRIPISSELRRNKLIELYETIFVRREHDKKKSIKIGIVEIPYNAKQIIIDSISLLSEFAIYND